MAYYAKLLRRLRLGALPGEALLCPEGAPSARRTCGFIASFVALTEWVVPAHHHRSPQATDSTAPGGVHE